jgi:uncharacterized membrane protein YoaK (UPF0700 family)
MPSTRSNKQPAGEPLSAETGSAPRRPVLALIVLAIGTGATDAFAFLCLGGVFTANMTGNLILVALFQRAGYLMTLVGAGTAIVVFTGTLFIVYKATGPSPRSSEYRRVKRGFGTVVLLQACVLAAWMILPQRSSVVIATTLIAVSAAAMATQTVITKRLATSSGVSTTFVTGTISSLMEELAEGKSANRRVQVLMPVCVVAGALAEASVIALAPEFAAILPLGVVLIGFAIQYLGEASPNLSAQAAGVS